MSSLGHRVDGDDRLTKLKLNKPLSTCKSREGFCIPNDLSFASQLQRITPLKIDKQQACLRLLQEITERIKYLVASVIWKHQVGCTHNVNKPWIAATMGHIGTIRMATGNEKGIDFGKPLLLKGCQCWTDDRRRHCWGDRLSVQLSQLNILRAIEIHLLCMEMDASISLDFKRSI